MRQHRLNRHSNPPTRSPQLPQVPTNTLQSPMPNTKPPKTNGQNHKDNPTKPHPHQQKGLKTQPQRLINTNTYLPNNQRPNHTIISQHSRTTKITSNNQDRANHTSQSKHTNRKRQRHHTRPTNSKSTHNQYQVQLNTTIRQTHSQANRLPT